MKIQAQLSHYVEEVPPRCRKPRPVRHIDTVEREIPEVTKAEAPIAFKRYARYRFERESVLRWHDERLWRIVDGNSHGLARGEKAIKITETERINWRFGSINGGFQFDFAEALRTDALFIDGLLYETDGEPRYEIYTQGLGGNHGGTGISVAQWYNGNVHRDRYFRADQWVEAKASAIEIALRRGDTESATRMRRMRRPLITVVLPEAVRCQPQQEHGEGDPFLNKLYTVSNIGDPQVAGIAALAILAGELAT